MSGINELRGKSERERERKESTDLGNLKKFGSLATVFFLLFPPIMIWFLFFIFARI